MKWLCSAVLAVLLSAPLQAQTVVATGDLGLVVERASGSLLLVDQSEHASLARIEGLGDLSHASLVYSPDERFAYVFGRDGGLTKVDLVEKRIDRRIVQSGNAIGGAISDDGKLVAVSNYEPGGVRIFDMTPWPRWPISRRAQRPSDWWTPPAAGSSLRYGMKVKPG